MFRSQGLCTVNGSLVPRTSRVQFLSETAYSFSLVTIYVTCTKRRLPVTSLSFEKKICLRQYFNFLPHLSSVLHVVRKQSSLLLSCKTWSRRLSELRVLWLPKKSFFPQGRTQAVYEVWTRHTFTCFILVGYVCIISPKHSSILNTCSISFAGL